MAGLSTRILDTSTEKPDANVKIELFERDNSSASKVCHTNSDGRTDKPVIETGNLAVGTYELHFHTGDHFRNNNTAIYPVSRCCGNQIRYQPDRSALPRTFVTIALRVLDLSRQLAKLWQKIYTPNTSTLIGDN